MFLVIRNEGVLSIKPIIYSYTVAQLPYSNLHVWQLHPMANFQGDWCVLYNVMNMNMNMNTEHGYEHQTVSDMTEHEH